MNVSRPTSTVQLDDFLRSLPHDRRPATNWWPHVRTFAWVARALAMQVPTIATPPGTVSITVNLVASYEQAPRS